MEYNINELGLVEVKTIYDFSNTDFEHPLKNDKYILDDLFKYFDVSILYSDLESMVVNSKRVVKFMDSYFIKPKENIDIINMMLFLLNDMEHFSFHTHRVGDGLKLGYMRY